MSNARYSENFKRDAIAKIKLHESVTWVADTLGVQPNTLRKWVREHEEGREKTSSAENSA